MCNKKGCLGYRLQEAKKNCNILRKKFGKFFFLFLPFGLCFFSFISFFKCYTCIITYAQVEITVMLPLIHKDDVIALTKTMFLSFSSSVLTSSQLQVLYIEIY